VIVFLEVNKKMTSFLVHCIYCKYETSSFLELLFHINQYHTKTYTPATCLQCNYVIYDLNLYGKHIAETHLPSIFVCSYCKHETYDSDSIQTHIQQLHTNQKKYLYFCPICDLNTTSKKLLDIHNKRCHGIEPNIDLNLFSCIICSFKTETKTKLNQHTKTCHVKKKQVFCDMCSWTGSCAKNLAQHKKIQHPWIETSSFLNICHMCDLTFENKCQLLIHSEKNH